MLVNELKQTLKSLSAQSEVMAVGAKNQNFWLGWKLSPVVIFDQPVFHVQNITLFSTPLP